MNRLVFDLFGVTGNHNATGCSVRGKGCGLLMGAVCTCITTSRFELKRFRLLDRILNRPKQHVVSRSVSLDQSQHVFVYPSVVSLPIHILVGGLCSIACCLLLLLLSNIRFGIRVAHLLELLLPGSFLGARDQVAQIVIAVISAELLQRCFLSHIANNCFLSLNFIIKFLYIHFQILF